MLVSHRQLRLREPTRPAHLDYTPTPGPKERTTRTVALRQCQRPLHSLRSACGARRGRDANCREPEFSTDCCRSTALHDTLLRCLTRVPSARSFSAALRKRQADNADIYLHSAPFVITALCHHLTPQVAERCCRKGQFSRSGNLNITAAALQPSPAYSADFEART